MKNKGFTLVELAIVLVIIGLLVGGVLQGQELIKQAQIRNVVATVNQVDVALNTFRAKYNNALPGDMAAAHAFAVDSPQGNGTENTAETSDGTAGENDGDGDGVLEGFISTGSWDGERMNFFVHLANANLIKGGYTQVDDCDQTAADCNTGVGTAYPSLPLGNGMIALSDTTLGTLNYTLGLGPTLTDLDAAEASAIGAGANTLTPEVAYALDVKFDDGSPDGGSTQAIATFTAGAFVDDAAAGSECYAATGVYAYTVTTLVCGLRVRASS